MTCRHLQKLYQLCQLHDIKMSSSDIVRIACGECRRIEVCPAVMFDECEKQFPDVEDISSESQIHYHGDS